MLMNYNSKRGRFHNNFSIIHSYCSAPKAELFCCCGFLSFLIHNSKSVLNMGGEHLSRRRKKYLSVGTALWWFLIYVFKHSIKISLHLNVLICDVIFFKFQSKVVNLGILAQKSEFYLQLEEALKSSNCKFSYEMTVYLMVVLTLRA